MWGRQNSTPLTCWIMIQRFGVWGFFIVVFCLFCFNCLSVLINLQLIYLRTQKQGFWDFSSGSTGHSKATKKPKFSVILMHAANSSFCKKVFPKYKMLVSLYSVCSFFLLERSRQNSIVQKNLVWHERDRHFLLF